MRPITAGRCRTSRLIREPCGALRDLDGPRGPTRPLGTGASAKDQKRQSIISNLVAFARAKTLSFLLPLPSSLLVTIPLFLLSYNISSLGEFQLLFDLGILYCYPSGPIKGLFDLLS